MEDIKEKLEKYFKITEEALSKIVIAKGNKRINSNDVGKDFLDLAKRYFNDAKYFKEKGDLINAFAAVTYAHAFLDCGARLGVFDVKDSRLFMVD